MNNFNFNNQKATLLYRNWYLVSKKNKKEHYDKEQVDTLRNYLLEELSDIIKHYTSQNIKAYRAELPILFIGEQKFETFPNAILVIGNSIQSLNLPGCMAIGENIEEAYTNYLSAVIECTDARYRKKMGFMNIVHTMRFYDSNIKDVERRIFLNELIKSGWGEIIEGVYNSILFKKGNKVTYTLPKTKTIKSSMVTWFHKLQFQISAKTEMEMYGDIQGYSY